MSAPHVLSSLESLLGRVLGSGNGSQGQGSSSRSKAFRDLAECQCLLASYWPREVTWSTESKSGRGLQGELAKSLEIGRGGELRAFL